MMRLLTQNKRLVLLCLGVDLLISAVFLAYAVSKYVKTADIRDLNTSTVQNGAQAASPIAELENAKVTKTKQMEVDRLINRTRQNVKEELSRQKETYRDSVNREDGWVSLDELKAISREAYDDCVRQLEHERKESEKDFEKRKKIIAELRADLLHDDELKELKEALEFLNICDDCKARGVPMPDRSADYDHEREVRLMRIARKYCCGLAGCSEEAIDMHDMASKIADPGGNYYLPILPRNVYNLKYE